jgi:Tfp pilus assembly protein PilN
MRVQFNLLPDVKQQYIKTQRTKKVVTMVALLTSAVCIGIFVLMLSVVYGVNKLQISSADNSVKKYQKQLNDIPNLNKILTVQSQLSSLLTLHQDKHVMSRLFVYLAELTPTSVKMGTIEVNNEQNTIEVRGTADTQKSINTFIDTLKFTTYKVDNKDTGKKAFPTVVESSFGIDQKGANYALDIQFDTALFANSQNVSLNIPAGVTTRSVLDDPLNALFNGQTGTENNNNSGSQ